EEKKLLSHSWNAYHPIKKEKIINRTSAKSEKVFCKYFPVFAVNKNISFSRAAKIEPGNPSYNQRH
ncbi:MAG: hypothetical protein K8T10_02545, partial [Candidatus Eremiobacteraeota bacterium]|nr:hypothetical protein [Candidatus Eremiobacteraeota bacterium]